MTFTYAEPTGHECAALRKTGWDWEPEWGVGVQTDKIRAYIAPDGEDIVFEGGHLLEAIEWMVDADPGVKADWWDRVVDLDKEEAFQVIAFYNAVQDLYNDLKAHVA